MSGNAKDRRKARRQARRKLSWHPGLSGGHRSSKALSFGDLSRAIVLINEQINEQPCRFDDWGCVVHWHPRAEP